MQPPQLSCFSKVLKRLGFRMDLEFLFAIEADELQTFMFKRPKHVSLATGDVHPMPTKHEMALEYMVCQLRKQNETTEVWTQIRTCVLDGSADQGSPVRWSASLIGNYVGLTDEAARLKHSNDWRLARIARSVVVPVRLMSPIFDLSRHEEAMSIVTAFLSTLTALERSAQPSEDTPYFAFVNSTCTFRLQVTVSPTQKKTQFGLNTIQKLAVLWGLYEKQLERLQPPHHRGDRDNESNSVSFAFSSSTPPEIFQQAVESTDDVEELAQIIDPGRYTNSFSRLSLLIRDCESPRNRYCHAIEFAEHAGTLSPLDIEHWLRLTLAVLKHASNLGKDEATVFVKQPAKLEELFEMIELDQDERVYWISKVLAIDAESQVQGANDAGGAWQLM